MHLPASTLRKKIWKKNISLSESTDKKKLEKKVDRKLVESFK